MNIQEQNIRDVAIATFKKEYDKAKTDGLEKRLQAVNDACDFYAGKGVIPTPANVITWIVTNRPTIKLTARTIYNDRELRDGSKVPSPYSVVIDAWAAVANEKALSKRAKTPITTTQGKEATGCIVSEKDLESIEDRVVRHKVSILIGQYNQAKNQAEMRKAIKENPPIPKFPEAIVGAQKSQDAIEHDITLNEDELEALSDFIKDVKANSRGLEFSDVGTVLAKRVNNGKPLSKPGFISAIRKIIDSYDPKLLG